MPFLEPQDLFAGNDFCSLVSNEEKGRYLIAKVEVQKGFNVVESQAYLQCILPSHKKRVCHACFRDHCQRLKFCCKACYQAYYCSENCRQQHWLGKQWGVQNNNILSSRCIPHEVVCKVIAGFASLKCDQGAESVLRLCLDILALKWLNQQKDNTTNSILSHESFSMLQSHVMDFDKKDKQEWHRFAKMFISILQKAHWQGDIPEAGTIVEYVSRILSNNFGIFILRNRKDFQNKHIKVGLVIDRISEKVDLQFDFVTNTECIGYQVLSREKQLTEKSGLKEQLTGRELHIVASFFNHSCQPNCVMARDGSGVGYVTALRDIKKGEELTISYIDADNPRSTRRLNLKKHFFFDCNCTKCEFEKISGKSKSKKRSKRATIV